MTTIAEAIIREASGRVVGPLSVHGAGGPLQFSEHDRRHLLTAIGRSTAERAFLDLYEPRHGHVRAYRHTAAADVGETFVDLRGATLLSWTPRS